MPGLADFPSFSIVIETDNVALSGLDRFRPCLDSIARQQPALARAKAVFLVESCGVSTEVLDLLGRDYPWLRVVHAGPATRYIGQKNLGASMSDSEVVVFCDGDVRYEAGWLDGILSGFVERPDAQIVAGETSTPIRGPYSLAVALTFVFPRFTEEREPARSPTYWANNLAVRRELIERFPIPDLEELYRGQNLLHSLDVSRRGLSIWRQPSARAYHAVIPPSGIIGRYLTLGRDAAHVVSLTRDASGRPYLAAMAPDESGGNPVRKLAGRLRQVVRANPLNLLMFPFALPIAAFFVVCYLIGRVQASPAVREELHEP